MEKISSANNFERGQSNLNLLLAGKFSMFSFTMITHYLELILPSYVTLFIMFSLCFFIFIIFTVSCWIDPVFFIPFLSQPPVWKYIPFPLFWLFPLKCKHAHRLKNCKLITVSYLLP